MRHRLPLRLRVTLGFTVAAALVLVALGGFVYLRVQVTLQEQTRAALATRLDAISRLPSPARADAAAELTGDTFAQVLDSKGRVVASSPTVREPLLRDTRVPQATSDVAAEVPVRLVGEDELETALVMARRAGSGQTVVVGTSREDVEEALDGILAQLLIGVPLALLLAAAVGHLVAGAALRPIEAIRQRAAAITADSSTERLPVPQTHDELQRLAQTLNTMLDRLDAGLRRERRFVAEAGHELRTPLAMLTTELDLALARPRSHEELLAAVRSASEEVSRLTRLSEDLLAIANPEADRQASQASEIDLSALLVRVAARFQKRATDHGRRLQVHADSDLILRGDPTRLDRAISNLIDNAVRHGSGDIELSAHAQRDLVHVTVADQGTGPPEEIRRHHATPPTMLDQPALAGAGLGLAIVDAIARQHGGFLTIGTGHEHVSRVTIALPTHA
jgi:signal transduction histidine kinase